LAVLVIGAGLAATGARQTLGDDRPSAGQAPMASASGNGRTDVGAGISVRDPAGWRVFGRPLTRVVSPVQRMVASSFALHQAQPDAGCAPATAMREMPRTGAWVYLIEYAGPSQQQLAGFPPRPAHFALSAGSYANYECMGASYLVRFGDAGRELQAEVYIGARADASTRAAALSVLDSLRISRLTGGP
jgi:hypothetical protein